ncbi:DUF4998 domain-containing protein [Niabella hirudinis]|uniref:DUF4998 domain-containing protein n=1 Tax=Niabella hirudinis TaxID=1285929 RepID=UPI003EBFCECE
MKINIHPLIAVLAAMTITGCKKMDDTYKKYVVPQGITYVERAKGVKTYSGLNRIKFGWLAPVDPTVSKARIYWNNFADSAEFRIPGNTDTVSYFLDVPEGLYSFIIKTFDDAGNQSVPVEVQGRSIGATFQSNMFSRPLSQTFVDNADGQLRLSWGGADTYNGSIGQQLTYTDAAGSQKKIFLNASENTTILTDYKQGTDIAYTTWYLADTTSVDTLKTAAVVVPGNTVRYRLDKSKFKEVKLAGDANMAWGWVMPNMWDGKTNAEPGFHTADAPFPQHITFDLGVSGFSLYSFRTWQRQGYQYKIGNMKRFSLWGSNTLAPELSSWTKLGDFTSGIHVMSEGELFLIPPGAAAYRYIRIQVQEAWDGKTVGAFHIMEIDLMANVNTNG